MAPPGPLRTFHNVALAVLRAPIPRDAPAPILVCLLVWAAISALCWAVIALVVQAL